MTRALVLGATGHIGAHVVRALLRKGYTVRAAYRSARWLSVLDGLSVERIQVNVDEPTSLRAVLSGCDWVFHAAGYYPRFVTRRHEALNRGLESTRRIFEALLGARPARVVLTSSAATIRRVPDRPARETDAEPWPLESWRSLYATVKIAMEHEALRAHQAGLPLVIVNPSVCLGEYDAHRFSGQAILAYAKYRLPVYLDQSFNAIYTGDVGMGHVLAAERGRLGERYLLTGQNVTVKAFARLVAQLAGVPPPRVRLPYGVALAMAWGTEWLAWMTRTEPLLPREAVRSAGTGQWLDGSKARQELGLPQTPLEEAIRRALAWFRAHGDL